MELRKASLSELVKIPSGEFLMGQASRAAGSLSAGCLQPGAVLASASLASGRDDENPVHRVWLAEFRMAPYPVTNAEWARFRPFEFADPQLPATSLSWQIGRAHV